MPAAAVQTRKPRGPRVDPKRRHVQGISPWMNLKNRDPNKHYVLAGPNGSEFDAEYFRALEYEIVITRPGGECFAAGRTSKDGEPVTYRGQHVLMACDMETYLERYEHGDGLGVGQAGYDVIMRQIRKSKPRQDILESNLRPGEDIVVGQSAEHRQTQELE